MAYKYAYNEDLRGLEQSYERPRQIVEQPEIVASKFYTPNLKTDNEDFRTFEKFIQFNQMLNMTTQLQKDGVITINQPFQPIKKDNVIEVEVEEREAHTFSGVALAIFGIIMIGLILV